MAQAGAAGLLPGAGCGAAIVSEGRILLLRRRTPPEPGYWGLPGGRIDLYETARAAAEREILEETGLAVAASDLLCLVDHIDPATRTHWVAPVYLATAFSGTPRIVEPEKHDGLDWFDLSALPEDLTVPTRAALAALAARRIAAG